ncbi:hypothetical protein AAMO2058_000782600 [Amorphochlora amoebiformis]
MDEWHKDCKITKQIGKHLYVNIPNILEAQYGCPLLLPGVEPPKKQSVQAVVVAKTKTVEQLGPQVSQKKKKRKAAKVDEDLLLMDVFSEEMSEEDEEEKVQQRVGDPGRVTKKRKTLHKIERKKPTSGAPGRNSTMDGYLSGINNKEVSALCVEMIALDLCPVTILERKGLKQLLQYLSPTMNVPSRLTMRKRIIAAHAIAKSVVKEELKSVDCLVHGTTDAWSSSAMMGYMSLTLHYVDQKFRIRRLPADVVRITGRHTAINMSHELNFLIEDSVRKLCTITTNSAANQIKAAALSIKSGHISVRLPCVSHVLNLAARKLCYGKVAKELADDEETEESIAACDDDEDEYEQEVRLHEAIDEEEDESIEVRRDLDDECVGDDGDNDVDVGHVTQVVKKMRRLACLLRKSLVLNEALLESQRKARDESRRSKKDLRVLIDVKTRWSSTFVMIGRALVLREHIEAAKSKATRAQRKKFLLDDDWDLLEEFHAALKPFAMATKVLSGESYVTSSKVLETWRRLMKTLKMAKDKNKFKVSDKAIDVFISALERYWDKYMQNMVYLCAAAFDPRHKKLKLLRSKKKRDSVWTRISQEGCTIAKRMDDARKKQAQPDDLSDESQQLAPLSESESDENECADASGQPSPAKPSKSSEDFRVTAEIAKYRAMPIPSKERSCDPLIWWKKHKELFPILSSVARGYLGAAASSVASERLFSLCGHVSSGRRSRIDSSLMSAIIYLNSCSRIPELWSVLRKKIRENLESGPRRN